jgi:hypothetical protein
LAVTLTAEAEALMQTAERETQAGYAIYHKIGGKWKALLHFAVNVRDPLIP